MSLDKQFGMSGLITTENILVVIPVFLSFIINSWSIIEYISNKWKRAPMIEYKASDRTMVAEMHQHMTVRREQTLTPLEFNMLSDLHQWHAREDDSGRKIWYVPTKLIPRLVALERELRANGELLRNIVYAGRAPTPHDPPSVNFAEPSQPVPRVRSLHMTMSRSASCNTFGPPVVGMSAASIGWSPASQQHHPEKPPDLHLTVLESSSDKPTGSNETASITPSLSTDEFDP